MAKLLIEGNCLTCYTDSSGVLFQQDIQDKPQLYNLNDKEPIQYSSLYYNDESTEAPNCYRVRSDTYLLTEEQNQEVKVWIEEYLQTISDTSLYKKAYLKSTGAVVHYTGKIPDNCTLVEKPNTVSIWNEKAQKWENPPEEKQTLKDFIACKEDEVNMACLTVYNALVQPEHVIKKNAAEDFLKQGKNSDVLKAVAESDPERYGTGKDKYKKAANAILEANKRTEDLIKDVLILREQRKLLRSCKSEKEITEIFNHIMSELNAKEV